MIIQLKSYGEVINVQIFEREKICAAVAVRLLLLQLEEIYTLFTYFSVNHAKVVKDLKIFKSK